MVLREQRVFTVQQMTAEERAKFGYLVLGTRKWVRAIRRNIIHIWLPDIAPSEPLLNTVHEKRKELLARCAKKGPFLRNRLTPEALQEWESFWFREFAPQYRQELHRRQSCRVVTYEEGKKDMDVPLSPVDYFLSLENLPGKRHVATILCCEHDGEECHRHLFLADALVIQATRQALSHSSRISLKVCVQGIMAKQVQDALEEKEVRVGTTPYLHRGQHAIYAAEAHHLQDVITILELPGIVSVEPMPTISVAATLPQAYVSF